MVSACAAYIYKYYTHMLTNTRTQEANVQTLAHTHMLFVGIDIHVSTHMHTFQEDDSQQGVDHVRKHRG